MHTALHIHTFADNQVCFLFLCCVYPAAAVCEYLEQVSYCCLFFSLLLPVQRGGICQMHEMERGCWRKQVAGAKKCERGLSLRQLQVEVVIEEI